MRRSSIFFSMAAAALLLLLVLTPASDASYKRSKAVARKQLERGPVESNENPSLQQVPSQADQVDDGYLPADASDYDEEVLKDLLSRIVVKNDDNDAEEQELAEENQLKQKLRSDLYPSQSPILLKLKGAENRDSSNNRKAAPANIVEPGFQLPSLAEAELPWDEDSDNSTDTTEDPTDFTTTTTFSPNDTTTTTTTVGSDDLSGGEIAGIVVGAIAGAAVLVGGVVYILYMKELFCFKKPEV